MDRRVFLLSTFAVTGCGLVGHGSLDIVCDPGLEVLLGRAVTAHGIGSGFTLSVCMPPEILRRVDGRLADLIVTRESKIADRLQRLGQVRLNDRWKASIRGAEVHILATREGDARRSALALGEWLAGEAAARHLTMTASLAPLTEP